MVESFVEVLIMGGLVVRKVPRRMGIYGNPPVRLEEAGRSLSRLRFT